MSVGYGPINKIFQRRSASHSGIFSKLKNFLESVHKVHVGILDNKYDCFVTLQSVWIPRTLHRCWKYPRHQETTDGRQGMECPRRQKYPAHPDRLFCCQGHK